MLPSNCRYRHVCTIHQTDAVCGTYYYDQPAVNTMDDLPLFFIGVLLIIVDVNHAFGLRETIDIFNLLRRGSLSGDLFNVVHHVRRFHLECGLLKNIRGLPGWTISRRIGPLYTPISQANSGQLAASSWCHPRFPRDRGKLARVPAGDIGGGPLATPPHC